MLILAIDTSGPVASVAVADESRIRYEAAASNKLTHSESLMPMIEEALNRAGVDLKQLTMIAAVAGPGSFTGIRIGITAAKALAHSLSIPCIGISSLEATAAGIESPCEVICPIQDARVQQVYGAAFLDGKRLMPDSAMKLTEFLDTIEPMGDRFLFTGDGVAAYHDKITERLGGKVRFAAIQNCYLRSAAVASLALRDQAQAVDYLTLQPVYLRPPQAERERAAREAAKHA